MIEGISLLKQNKLTSLKTDDDDDDDCVIIDPPPGTSHTFQEPDVEIIKVSSTGGQKRPNDEEISGELKRLRYISEINQEDMSSKVEEKRKSNLARLKETVVRILQRHEGGVRKSDLWSIVQKETRQSVSGSDYGVKKMSSVLDMWSDIIGMSGKKNQKVFLIKPVGSHRKSQSPSDAVSDGNTDSAIAGAAVGENTANTGVMSNEQVSHIDTGRQEPQKGLYGLQWSSTNQMPFWGSPASSGQTSNQATIPSLLGTPAPNFDQGGTYSALKNQSDNNQANPLLANISHSAVSPDRPVRDDIKQMVIKTIDKEVFETKNIDVRPVYVPRGRKPPKEQINTVAKECIEILADANLFVTQERVEKLICQRFNCHRIQELGPRYVDQIDCVNELNRLICKINTYIHAFLKTRSICTLHELKEALLDYATEGGDFSSLKTGPLQRFPVVYHQFRFPPDQVEIPEITTMDILDHLHNYLSVKSLWSKKLELEPFMDYLIGIYGADNAYMLGVRIRSLALGVGVLKKAQRDAAAKHRAIKQHFEDELKTEIGEAFRKFRVSILQTGDSEGMEIRKHYLKVKPALAIKEIIEKFNILHLVTQVDGRHRRTSKFKKAVEDFFAAMNQDDLGKDILHLAICMSNTDVEETVKELFTPVDDGSDDEEKEAQTQQKPPPRKDALVKSLKKYIERCLNAGTLSLVHLDRIEEKLLEEFEFSTFSLMGYGRFLEFLLAETKAMLEEGGGLSLGSGSGGSGDAESSFKPTQNELMEFIKQCKQQDSTQLDQIEEALCRQYGVKEVRHLGHGNIARLLSSADKHGKYMFGDFAVFYESAFLRPARFSSASDSKVGILGHQTKDAAKFCLHNCPLLENMADWSQWSLVFEPELGKLKDFVQKYGGVSTKTFEGGKLVTLDFLAMELRPGELIKIVSTTSPDFVAEAVRNCDVMATAGHIVSMVVAYKGVESMPMALLSGHIKTTLLQMHAADPSSSANSSLADAHTASMFVLQCLLRIPTNICVAVANQLFLEPLGQVVGSSKSKRLLMNLCRTVEELNKMVKLGCLLGIHEWTDVMQQKCQPPAAAVQIETSEIHDFFGNEDQEEEEEDEVTEDSDTEDLDEILAGDDEEEAEDDKETKDDKEIKQTEIFEKSETEDGVLDQTEETVETENTADSNEEEKAEETVLPSCEDIVNQIRRDEFGVGVHLNEDGQRLMKVQQERLGRSLDRLSKDLYSKDTHFVLELVQNADDNSYHDNLLNNTIDECPSVKFVIEHDGIYVYNNELGFREKDIRALCDVGRSTKGKHKFGYIGQKGIGFKSVFRITDAPEVHSNGYHIKFDVNSGPMGYILPHWVPEENRASQDGWMTQIILKLKTDMRLQTRTLAARFNDIHPSLLLFLHRLRQITIENKVENTVQTMKRRDVGDSVVEIQYSGGCDRWLVVKKMLDASNISLQTKSGVEVESTEIALAFLLQKQGKKNTMQTMPPKQPVFAFLPLRRYGFRFIIQGDFDVPSSREDVDRDSPWNQWLRNEIPSVFIETLDIFKTHSEFNSMEAVCAFLQFVPMEDEVLEFFKPVALDILKKLKAKPCIPTQPNRQGVISWKIPSQTVRVRDPLVRSVITPDLLQTHLNLYYLHGDIAAVLNPALTSCLGIETLTSDHLFQLGKALILNMGTHCDKDTDVILISKWMACLYRSLDEFHHDDTILSTLKGHRMLPLSDGELVALQDKTVFYPIPDSGKNRQKGKDPLYYLQQDVNSLHPLLLNTEDQEVNSQVHKLLLRLGVKQLSPFDVINHHIIPVLKSDTWQSKSEGTLVSYMVYIKEQTEKQMSVCNLDEVKDVAMVMTNMGFKNPSREPVHFPPQYGNQINLQDVFKGYDWTLLDPCYLPHTCTQPVIITWQDFFRKLGVEDFLSVRKKDVHIKKQDLATSYWSTVGLLWPKEEPEFIVQDYYSVELEELIRNNKYSSGVQFENQMRNLCMYLDHSWDNRLSKYCKTHVLDKDGKILKETDTSFSILLKTSKWLPAEETETKAVDGHVTRDVRTVIKEPGSLYLKSAVVQNLLSDKVLYLDVNLSGGSFYQFLGLRNSVSIETVKSSLIQWCVRQKNESPALFCTSLEHMKNVYTYLGRELKRQELQDLLRDHPVFFVPNTSTAINSSVETVVCGNMLSRSEIWLSDRTGLFDKHRILLEEFHSDICHKRTIAGFYYDRQDIISLFVQEGKVDSQPKVEEYIELLGLLCTSYLPKEAKMLSDVLFIFSTIGQALVTQPEGMPDEQTARMALESMKTTVKKKLQRQKVFPTNKLIWVSLEEKPMIPDNREWEKMFSDKEGVHFLDMEDKSAKISRKGRGLTMHRGLKNKVVESRVQPEMIDVVIDVCDIKRLSEVVDIRPTPELIEPCVKLQAYFSQIVSVVQQYLAAKYEDVYHQLELMNTKQMLADAKFYQTSKLEVSYWLNNLPNTYVIQQEKCVVHPPEFYFHRDHLNALMEINREMARYFSVGNMDCSTSLRSFLTELSYIVTGETEDTPSALLQCHDADYIEIPEEEKWKVEAPVLPEPDKPEQEQEVIEEPVDSEERETGSESKGSGSGEMRAWPPVSDVKKNQQPKEHSERPASSIWPPPKAKDYMKSVKDLPSNIRMVAAGDVDKTGSNETETKTVPTESGDGTVPRQQGYDGNQSHPQGVVKTYSAHISGSLDKSESQVDRGPTEGQATQMEKKSGNQSDNRSVEVRNAIPSVSDSAQPVHKGGNTDMTQPDGTKVGGHHEIGGEGSADYTHRSGGGNVRNEARRHYHYNRGQAIIKGDPVWSYMATEYMYEELGSGKDLGLVQSLQLIENEGDKEIGQWGEELVAQYLQRQKDLGNIVDFSWKNVAEETGSPYDFEVQLAGDHGVVSNFIEVKSTMTEDKEVFEISVQQVKFAEQEKENFHIYRVFNAGDPERVNLIRISNLDMRLSTKQVKLCMLI